MGSSNPDNKSLSLSMATFSTSSLRDRLNRVYLSMRSNRKNLPSSGLFEYLWDLKEAALSEGRSHVQIPSNWLEELEICYGTMETANHRTH